MALKIKNSDTMTGLNKLELFETKLQNVIYLNEKLVKRNNELNRKLLDLEMAFMKKKDKTMQEKLKDWLLESANRTTFHGAKYLTFESNLVKITWVVFIAAAVSFCFYYIYLNLADFYSYGVITNINLRTDTQTLFPAVTICSINNNFNYNLSEILIECKFNQRDCVAKEFNIVVDKNLGLCYTFNSIYNSSFDKIPLNELLTVSQSGKSYGLSLELFAGLPEQTKQKNDGFYVFIHNNTERFIDRQAVEVAKGLSTNLMISRDWDRKLSSPYNDCLQDLASLVSIDPILYKLLIYGNYSYTRNYCIDLCKDVEVLNQCNCTQGFVLPDRMQCSDNVFKIPVNDFGENCIEKVNNNFYKKEFKKCLPLCPRECEAFTYEVSLSFSEYPSDSYLEVILNKPLLLSKFPVDKQNKENIKKSVIAINVFYRDLHYTEVSQLPKSAIADILASLGGNLGLFMGVSLLTLIEGIQVFLGLFYISLRHVYKSRKNKVKDVEVVMKNVGDYTATE